MAMVFKLLNDIMTPDYDFGTVTPNLCSETDTISSREPTNLSKFSFES